MDNLELKVEKEVKEEEVKEILEQKGEVTNEKIENSLNYDSLTEEEKSAIEDFNKKIKKLMLQILHKFYNMEQKLKVKYHNFLIVY